ncbi:hypothetical protein BDA96_01G085100 [Sorghum bicolor]|uniref:Uncharacterized protein n=2 Tax=Sorghum bicolor TaxID=4558 RepID=A0A921UXZ4_SORBI|nr:hypothetical protein BDA96_01G085100 [Sorghum bicolor]OQU90941.1 hypothetical protein SORBI_3001G081450 [Sorghum bicolor]
MRPLVDTAEYCHPECPASISDLRSSHDGGPSFSEGIDGGQGVGVLNGGEHESHPERIHGLRNSVTLSNQR